MQPLFRFSLPLILALALVCCHTVFCGFAAAAPVPSATTESSDAAAPPDTEPEKLKIAILEFDAVNEEAKKGNKGRMISEIFTTAAFKSGLFQVVERHLIKKVLNEMEYGESAFSGTDAQKIGELLGADAVLTGAVSEFLGALRIDARLINTKDGRVLLADGSQAKLTMDSISEAVSLLMRKMIAVLRPGQPAATESAAATPAPQVSGAVLGSAVGQATNQAPAAVSGPVPGQNWTDPLTGMQFVWIRGGCFSQGSPRNEPGRDKDEPLQRQCVKDFWMGATEVTIAQFEQFVQAQQYVSDAERQGYSWIYSGKKTKIPGDSWRHVRFAQNGREPVVNVSWNDAVAFARWLSARSYLHYQLPDESQWEYACRAGAQGRYFWGGNESQACAYANVHDRTSRRINGYTWTPFPCDDGFAQTAPAGSFAPNNFGLYDMLGNVWEWTRTRASKGRYIARGGSWDDHKKYVRCANRDKLAPNFQTYSVGFRLVLQ